MSNVCQIVTDATNKQLVLQVVDAATGSPVGGQPSVTVALGACNGRQVAMQQQANGAVVLASPDFTGGSGGALAPFLFLGFTTPHGSPDGTSEVVIYGIPWNMAWATSRSLTGLPTMYVKIPEGLKSTITKEFVPDITGYGNGTEVDYTAYDYSAFGSGAYWHQQRTATPASGSGLLAATQYICPPYLASQIIWIEPAATLINVQISSLDPVQSATVANGGTGTYVVGDVLTLAGGTGSAASLKVASVGTGAASGATIINCGAGYKPGDTLTVSGGTGTAATLTVTAVNDAGQILAATLASGGSYTVAPSTGAATTGGTGTGATVTLTLALAGQVATVTVNNGGAYSVAPTNPVSIASGGGGSGATFNLYYTLITWADANKHARAWAQ